MLAMLRSLDEIARDLRAVAAALTLDGVTDAERERLIARFHRLHEEQKRTRRALASKRIYFLHAPSVGLVKIGYSADAASRIASLHLSSPVPLVLLGTVRGGKAREAEYHNAWSSQRRHGEWFVASEDLLATIEADIQFDRTRAAG